MDSQIHICPHCGEEYEVVRTGLGMVNDHLCNSTEMRAWRTALLRLEKELARYIASPQSARDRFYVDG